MRVKLIIREAESKEVLREDRHTKLFPLLKKSAGLYKQIDLELSATMYEEQGTTSYEASYESLPSRDFKYFLFSVRKENRRILRKLAYGAFGVYD